MDATPPKGDTLCEKCSVLTFDDGVFRDFVEEDDDDIMPQPHEIDDGCWEWINELLKLDYEHTDTYPELPGLAASAKAGCTFCAVLREATLEKNHNFPETCTVTYRLRYIWSPPCVRGYIGLYMLLAELEVNDDNSDVVRTSIAFVIESAEETCEDWLQTMLAPPQHALCDENVAWIQQELDDDEAGYVQHTRSEFLPTRLLDVEADAHTDSVRLIETTTMVTCPRYLALSYCWGDQSAAAQQLKTTSSTLRKHFDSLPPDRTTIIVHDAVKVARALHVRYLWIDALCIIQDDGEDWARESRVMGLVYTNAYATICALAASSCLEGFVIRNDPEVRIHFQSSLRPNVAGLLHIYRQKALDSVGDSNTALPDHFRYLDEEVSAWNSRAWVYQEEKLSKRKILFGKSRIHLALSDRQLTEGIDKSWASNDVLKPSSFHDEYRQFIQSGDMEILQNSWLTAVQLFSEKKISDKQDRFPAISGLARLMAVPLADTYVAGLWRNDLLRGLLWEREFESITPPASDHAPSSQLHYLRQITRPGSATYIGPSWSWPHGQTYQPRYTMTHKMPPDNGVRNHSLRSECMSLNAWSQPENLELNPFGRINDARLYVEARCLPLPSSLQPVLSGRMFVGQQATLGDGSIAICNLDWEGIGDKHEFMLQDVSMLLLASCIAYTPLIAERLQVLKRETPAQVQENLITEAAESYDTERIAWGLLLHPVEDDKFVRIGRFKVYPQHGGLRAFQGCEWKAVELI